MTPDREGTVKHAAVPSEGAITLPAPPPGVEFTRDRRDTEPRGKAIRGREWRGRDTLLTRADKGFWR